ncbi:MAG: HNH nuclease [Parcubacteria group bacterium Athens0714_16]|nr:MAG: HNH nuclease [Parcubacteria group bacterium Athens0714_16]
MFGFIWRVAPNGKALVLKTSGRKPLEVRVLYPPPKFGIQISAKNMITNNKLTAVFNKTKGHCHFCGDSLTLKKYGVKDIDNLNGSWEADHVIQKGRGGSKDIENCLPSCVHCNRLRWHRKGNDLRDLIFLGLIVNDEIKKNTAVGNKIIELKNKRIIQNKNRRRNIK